MGFACRRVLAPWVCCHKIPQAGDSNSRHSSPTAWRLEGQELRARHGRVPVETLCGAAGGQLPEAPSPGGRGEGALGGLWYKDPDPAWALPSRPAHEAPPPDTIPSGGRFQCVNLGDTQAFDPLQGGTLQVTFMRTGSRPVTPGAEGRRETGVVPWGQSFGSGGWKVLEVGGGDGDTTCEMCFTYFMPPDETLLRQMLCYVYFTTVFFKKCPQRPLLTLQT